MAQQENIVLPAVPDINIVRSEGFSYPEYVATQQPEEYKPYTDKIDPLVDICRSDYNLGIKQLQTAYALTGQDVTEDMVKIAKENGMLIDYLEQHEAEKEIQKLNKKRRQLVSVLKAVENQKSQEEAEAKKLTIKQEKEMELQQSEARVARARQTGNFKNITFHDINRLPRKQLVIARNAYYQLVKNLPKKMDTTNTPLGELYKATRGH